MSEPGWPDKYNNKALLCDWGRSQIFIHDVKAQGPSFIAKEPETFVKSRQVTDIDVDASGRVYISAWAGASFKGHNAKGYVESYIPEGLEYKPFPKLSEVSEQELLKYLASESQTARVDAQQEILARKATQLLPATLLKQKMPTVTCSSCRSCLHHRAIRRTRCTSHTGETLPRSELRSTLFAVWQISWQWLKKQYHFINKSTFRS